MGESVSGHGYVVWSLPEKTYELIELPNEKYGYYKFKIFSEGDIDADKEQLLNE